MIKNVIIIFSILLNLVIFGDAGIFDGPRHTCGVSDHECHRKFFQRFGSYYSKIGIPEIGLPILDPIQLTDVTVSIPNLINVTLIKGQAAGVADCLTTKYETFIENKTKTSELLCNNITIWGHYNLTLGSYIKDTLGDIIHGNGKIRVELEKWYFNLQYPFKLDKHKNGDIYMKILFDKVTYEDSIGNVKIDIQNIRLGDQDISQTVTAVLNKNWKIFEPTFGRRLTAESLKFYYDAHNLFYNLVPTKYYITEDLSPYL